MLSVLALRADVCLEFAFGHLGVTNAQASSLAQVGRSVLIGQIASRLLALLLLFESAWLFRLIGGKAPPAARDSNELARALNRHCYPLVSEQ